VPRQRKESRGSKIPYQLQDRTRSARTRAYISIGVFSCKRASERNYFGRSRLGIGVFYREDSFITALGEGSKTGVGMFRILAWS